MLRLVGHLRLAFCSLFVFLVPMTFVLAGPRAAFASVTTPPDGVTLDASGWSDPSLGTWDSSTKTGTLTTDVVGSIHVLGVRLDGADRNVTGAVYADATQNNALVTTGAVVANLGVDGNVYLGRQDLLTRSDVNGQIVVLGPRTSVLGNSISGSGLIHPWGDNYILVHGNVFEHAQTAVDLDERQGDVTGNEFVSCATGVKFWNHGITVSDNVFADSGTGVWGDLCPFEVANNDFNHTIEPVRATSMDAYGGMLWSVSGNCWSDWTVPDADNDGIVDVPRLSGSQWDGAPVYDLTPHVAPHHPLTGMQLNGGASTASSRNVTVNSSRSAVQMRFRNAGGDWSPWQAYATSASWVVTEGVGQKTVDAEYRDASGNLFLVSDSILVPYSLTQLAPLPDGSSAYRQGSKVAFKFKLGHPAGAPITNAAAAVSVYDLSGTRRAGPVRFVYSGGKADFYVAEVNTRWWPIGAYTARITLDDSSAARIVAFRLVR